MQGLQIHGWDPQGAELSLDADAEHELPWAFVKPRADGDWRWEAGVEDEWRTPLGQAAGKANTQAEAKTAAENWLRDQ
ncbi:hypothetical protein ACT17_05905 [Mycolicibacterium conceptionense]|uniref:Uncharacterized protein n=1 Tax=Mycolicibacterium conceptionense TaxID=451644 RepID=A0A0J8X297_9MYCO|nr:hypothetical protein [Mycolicibacterium conceptionense]KMV19584.1 hypothetical protein ACT17_05905 [Mycolicibacterium conceptionense]